MRFIERVRLDLVPNDSPDLWNPVTASARVIAFTTESGARYWLECPDEVSVKFGELGRLTWVQNVAQQMGEGVPLRLDDASSEDELVYYLYNQLWAVPLEEELEAAQFDNMPIWEKISLLGDGFEPTFHPWIAETRAIDALMCMRAWQMCDPEEQAGLMRDAMVPATKRHVENGNVSAELFEHFAGRGDADMRGNYGTTALAAPPVRKPIPQDVKMYVWRRDQGRCAYCGDNRNLEYDHIIPVSKGGANTERNIQLLCQPCNRSKGARI